MRQRICRKKKMKRELEELIQKLNAAESDTDQDAAVQDLAKTIDLFSSDSEKVNNSMVDAAKEKLAEVFSLSALKSMNQCFVSDDFLLYAMHSSTVKDSKCLFACNIETGEENMECSLSFYRLTLTDGTDIYLANAQEVSYE